MVDEAAMDQIAVEMRRIQARVFKSDTRQASVFGIGISFIVFTTIVMFLRFYVRFFITHGVGMDDSESTINPPQSGIKHVPNLANSFYAPRHGM
jgi:hypothetical protein